MPLVSQTFDQLLDFTRTTSGTFVGSNGLIQTTPASVNLLTWTQQFDNAAWANQVAGTGVAATVTANAGTAPDDTSTADRLQFSLAGGLSAADITRRRQDYTTPATTHTFSVYLRSTDGTSTYNMHIISPAGATTNIVVTGSWQRFTVTGTGLGGVISYAVGLRGGQTPANSNTADVLAWGAQLEAASAATTYTRNNGGRFPPRFDYDPVTLAPKGLLIEEQRTNLVLYSAQFDNAAWAKNSLTVTANATVAPDGTTTADKIIKAAVTTQASILQGATTVVGAQTISFFAKAAEYDTVSFTLYNATDAHVARGQVNLSTGAVIATQNGVITTQSFGNGWWRITATGTTTVSAGNTLYIYPKDVTTYLGNGVDGIFVWGAQLEAGAFATSYIPTVASQVTRTADQCSIVAPNFAPWYNQSEGTFVSEFSFFASADTVNSKAYFAVSDGTTNNRIFGNLATTSVPFIFIAVGGAAQANLNTGTAVTNNSVAKVATAYKTNDFAAVLNAGTVATDTSGTVPTVDRLGIGNLNNFSQLNGHVRSIRYYPTRLTNAQLQALTA